MLIVHGKKVRRVPCGYCVDFCPICRGRRVFAAVEVRVVSHVYFISLGRGSRAAVELVCPDCSSVFGRDPRDCRIFLDAVEADRDEATPIELVQRLGLERRAAARSLTAGEREALIAEPFVALRYMADMRTKGGSESVSAVVTLLAIILAGVTVLLIGDHQPMRLTIPFGAGAAVFVAWAVERQVHKRRRAVRGPVFERLVTSLRPLKPRVAELENVLGKLRPGKCLVGRAVQAQELQNEIELREVAVGRS